MSILPPLIDAHAISTRTRTLPPGKMARSIALSQLIAEEKKMDSLFAHTPLPWDYVEATEHHGDYITTAFGTTVCDFYAMSDPTAWSTANGGDSKPVPFTQAAENAKAVVKAVNAHDALVDVIRKALLFVESEVENREYACTVDNRETDPGYTDYIKPAEDIRDALAAALKLAGPPS